MEKEALNKIGVFMAQRAANANLWAKRGGGSDERYETGVLLGAREVLKAIGHPVEVQQADNGYFKAVVVCGETFPVRE